MPFIKGESGNPAGRPLGARNRQTLANEALLAARAEELINLAIERAKAGNMAALRMCLDRLVPRGTERPLQLDLPPTVSAADTERAVADIKAAVGTGEVTPREALALLQIVERSVRIVTAAYAAERAGMREPVGAEATASPAEAGPACNQPPAEETIKNNAPSATGNGAAEPRGHDEDQRTQDTAKCNEPIGPMNGAADPGAHGTERRMEDTAKYNEPREPMDGAADPGAHGTEQQMENTAKYNEPLGPVHGTAELGPDCEKQQTEKTMKSNNPSAHPGPDPAPAPSRWSRADSLHRLEAA